MNVRDYLRQQDINSGRVKYFDDGKLVRCSHCNTNYVAVEKNANDDTVVCKDCVSIGMHMMFRDKPMCVA